MLIQECFTGYIRPWFLPSHSIQIGSTVNIAITYCSMCMLLLGQLFIHTSLKINSTGSRIASASATVVKNHACLKSSSCISLMCELRCERDLSGEEASS